MKKTFFKGGLLLLLAILTAVTAMGCGGKSTGGSKTAIALTGGWYGCADEGDAGESGGWYKNLAKQAGEIGAPVAVDAEVSWLGNTFRSNLETGNGQRVILTFTDLGYYVKAWLNGKEVGEHEGSYGSFSFDITDLIKGGSNELALRIVNPAGQVQLRGVSGDQLPVGAASGLPSTVTIEVCAEVWIEDTYIQTDYATGKAMVTLALNNMGNDAAAVTVGAEISTQDTNAVMDSRSGAVTAQPGRSEHTLELSVAGMTAWSTANPYLYTVSVWARADGATQTDRDAAVIGFKELTVDEDGLFWLNGSPIYLKMFNLSAADIDSEQTLRRTIDYLRVCGFNTVRITDGSAPQLLLDYCDMTGVLVYEQSAFAGKNSGAVTGEVFIEEIARLAARSRRHVSLGLMGLLSGGEDAQMVSAAKAALATLREYDAGVIALLCEEAAVGTADKLQIAVGADWAEYKGALYSNLSAFTYNFADDGALNAWYEDNGLDARYPNADDALRAHEKAEVFAADAALEKIRAAGAVTGFGFSLPAGTTPESMADVIRDGANDLRWTLELNDEIRGGQAFHLKISISNLNVIKSRGYAATVRITGNGGTAYERTVSFTPGVGANGLTEAVIPVFNENITLKDAGEYVINVYIEDGAIPTSGEKTIAVVGQEG